APTRADAAGCSWCLLACGAGRQDDAGIILPALLLLGQFGNALLVHALEVDFGQMQGGQGCTVDGVGHIGAGKGKAWSGTRCRSVDRVARGECWLLRKCRPGWL